MKSKAFLILAVSAMLALSTSCSSDEPQPGDGTSDAVRSEQPVPVEAFIILSRDHKGDLAGYMPVTPSADVTEMDGVLHQDGGEYFIGAHGYALGQQITLVDATGFNEGLYDGTGKPTWGDAAGKAMFSNESESLIKLSLPTNDTDVCRHMIARFRITPLPGDKDFGSEPYEACLVITQFNRYDIDDSDDEDLPGYTIGGEYKGNMDVTDADGNSYAPYQLGYAPMTTYTLPAAGGTFTASVADNVKVNTATYLSSSEFYSDAVRPDMFIHMPLQWIKCGEKPALTERFAHFAQKGSDRVEITLPRNATGKQRMTAAVFLYNRKDNVKVRYHLIFIQEAE